VRRGKAEVDRKVRASVIGRDRRGRDHCRVVELRVEDWKQTRTAGPHERGAARPTRGVEVEAVSRRYVSEPKDRSAVVFVGSLL
jgi:hypothetical protein